MRWFEKRRAVKEFESICFVKIPNETKNSLLFAAPLEQQFDAKIISNCIKLALKVNKTSNTHKNFKLR